MKAIVHIGTEKTGTTSIQEFLYQNKNQLKNAGFHFIQSAGERNNRILPAYCIDDDQFDDYYREQGVQTPEERKLFRQAFLKKFEKEIRSVPKNTHTCIISSEHFHSRIRSEAAMDNVHRLLSAYFDELKIVCYLREQATTCTSAYSTHMKTGGTDSFAQYLQRCTPRNYIYNYHSLLGNWENRFGFEAMDVALFVQDRFLNGDLLDDFTAKLDPSLVGTLLKPGQPENESLKPIGQALARALNMAFPVRTGRPETHDLRHRCKGVISQRFTGRGLQPSFTARTSIYEKFIESNERVRQKYFPELETLFSPPIKEKTPAIAFSEDDFHGIADVFEFLRQHGTDAMLPEEYARVCTTIISCISDVTGAATEETEGGAKAYLSQDDAAVVLLAAGAIKGRDPKSALALVALARRAFPNSPGIKEQWEEYRQRNEQAPKPQFLATYHEGDAAVDQDKLQELMPRLHAWVASLDVPEGSPLIHLANSIAVRADGHVVESDRSNGVAFSLFHADSLDDARSIASKSPFLELGGSIAVSEVVKTRIQ